MEAFISALLRSRRILHAVGVANKPNTLSGARRLHSMRSKYLLLSSMFTVLLVCLGGSCLLSGSAPVAQAQAQTQASCGVQWTLMTSPNVPGGENVLDALSASSPNDIWAVGYSYDSSSGQTLAHTLAEHWDGKTWKIVSTPNPGVNNNYLDGVRTFTPNNAWAVGDAGDSKTLSYVLLHWDGTSWMPVSVPGLDVNLGTFYAIDGAAPNDIWIVGLKRGGTLGDSALIYHYDGNQWSNIDTSLPYSSFGVLDNVVAHSANDVWAVGTQGERYHNPYELQLHWDGHQWQDMAEQPKVGGAHIEEAFDLAIAGPDNARFLVGANGNQPGILHIDGPTQEATGNDFRIADYNILTGVIALSRTEAWAVGYGVPGGQSAKNGQHRLPLVLHTTNGSDWRPEQTVPIEGDSSLLDIIVVPGTQNMIAVGSANGANLIETYADPCAAPPAVPATATTHPTSISRPSPSPTSTSTSTSASTPPALPTFAATPIPGEDARSQSFPETGKSVRGIFLDYWQQNGGLAQQGYPISNEFTEISPLDGKAYTLQYFERAVFEYHPENPPPYNVLLSQLGTFQYQRKYGSAGASGTSGAPSQQPNDTQGSVLFPQTGHRVGGMFLQYWQSHGGLAQQGYPISDEFQEKSDLNGKTYLVQYFERAVFEMHPENQSPFDVLLSQLGTFQFKLKYP